MRSSPLVICFLVYVLFISTLVRCQDIQHSPRFPLPPTPAEDPNSGKREREIVKRENHQRQAQLKHDTENLLKLATELKQYVDKSNENTLSVDVIRKAEDIEKLARSIKDKMKGN